MFDRVYEIYVKIPAARWIYQIGFVLAWAVWAATSLYKNEVTWLVFGWLPAVFWPVEFVARLVLCLPQDVLKLLGVISNSP